MLACSACGASSPAFALTALPAKAEVVLADGFTVITRIGKAPPEAACQGNDSPTWILSVQEGAPPVRRWRPRAESTIIDDGLLLWFLAVVNDPAVLAVAARTGFPSGATDLALGDVDADAYHAVVEACRRAKSADGASVIFDRRGWGSSSIRVVENYAATITVLEVVHTRIDDPWGLLTYTAPSWRV